MIHSLLKGQSTIDLLKIKVIKNNLVRERWGSIWSSKKKVKRNKNIREKIEI